MRRVFGRILRKQSAEAEQRDQHGRAPKEKGAEWIHRRIKVTSPACSTDVPSMNTAATRQT